MNIFYLDDDISKSVKYHLDSHTNKIVTEAAQCVSVAWHVMSSNLPSNINWMGQTHENHPINIWLCESYSNLLWASEYILALKDEYHHRYGKPWNLAREMSIAKYTLKNKPDKLLDIGITPFKVAVETDCIVQNNPVQTYRNFYNKHKRHLFFKKNGTPRWTNRPIPDFIEL